MRGEAVIEAQACPASGARGITIDTLEVMESDFAATLTEEKNQEADEAAEHEKITRENKVTKILKELDVKYKDMDFKNLDKQLNDLASDEDSLSTETADTWSPSGRSRTDASQSLARSLGSSSRSPCRR